MSMATVTKKPGVTTGRREERILVKTHTPKFDIVIPEDIVASIEPDPIGQAGWLDVETGLLSRVFVNDRDFVVFVHQVPGKSDYHATIRCGAGELAAFPLKQKDIEVARTAAIDLVNNFAWFLAMQELRQKAGHF